MRVTLLVPFLLGLVLAGAPPARAQQSVHLVWKWREGDERRYLVESTLDHTVETQGVREDTRMTSAHTFHVIERVTEVDEDGVATVTQTYQRVQVSGTVKGPGVDERFEYDSALRTAAPTQPPTRTPSRPAPPRRDDDAAHPMVAPYASLAGRTITFRVDAEGRVLSCTGADESAEGMFEALSGDGDNPINPALALFRAAVNNDSLREQFQSSLNLIPGRTVRRGDAWDLSISQTLPLVGEIHTDMECRLTAIRGRQGSQFATIDNKGGMSLHGGPAGTSSLGGLFQLSLTTSDMQGTTEFDAELGHIGSSRQQSSSEWEIYAPDFSDLDRLGEPIKSVHRLRQDVTMRLER